MARVHLENQLPRESDDDDTSDEEGEIVDEMEMEHAQLSKAPVFTAVMAESLQPDGSASHDGVALNERPDAREGTKKSTKSKARRCTPEVKALSVSAFLFSFITVVQIFAAHIAHSQALLMDCISMGVDAFTYLGNIVVECRKRDGETHAKSQLIIVATSLGLLCYFTADAMKESWGTIQVCLGRADAKDEDDVNGWITLGFALGGVGFDLMCLLEFYKSNKKTGSVKSVNMFSALLHVSADFLRSTSTLIMSLLILLCKVDSTCIDAYTSVFIGITIISGAFVGFFKWIKLLITFCCKERLEKA